jgi:hypothetical protein
MVTPEVVGRWRSSRVLIAADFDCAGTRSQSPHRRERHAGRAQPSRVRDPAVCSEMLSCRSATSALWQVAGRATAPLQQLGRGTKREPENDSGNEVSDCHERPYECVLHLGFLLLHAELLGCIRNADGERGLAGQFECGLPHPGVRRRRDVGSCIPREGFTRLRADSVPLAVSARERGQIGPGVAPTKKARS